jgi:hypothetical protein
VGGGCGCAEGGGQQGGECEKEAEVLHFGWFSESLKIGREGLVA